MDWQDLASALCLMLVIEGALPFLYPNRWKEVVAKLAQLDSRQMRLMGGLSMLIGLGMLFVVRA
jgi:uncharacterized protein YjeT (DUF2065 family)